MRWYLLLILVFISGCDWNYYDKLEVDIIFEVTVLDNNNDPVPYTNYNVESFKMKQTPMLRSFAWEIRRTDENGVLRYYLNQDIRSGETIQLCVLEQCSVVEYWEAVNSNKIAKIMTVVDNS